MKCTEIPMKIDRKLIKITCFRTLDILRNFMKFKQDVDHINCDHDVTYHAEVNIFSVLTEEERQEYTGMNITCYYIPFLFIAICRTY